MKQGIRIGLVFLVGASVGGAQETQRPIVPQIVTTATSEVRVPPDRATVSIGVQTRAATAAAAATQNAQKQRAVIDAVKAKGVAAEQISTSNFNVIPETQYDREGRAAPRTPTYLVVNTVIVELRRMELAGPVIDAALTAGANQINSLEFGVQNPDSARRAALGLAVAKSRADADVIARAAGGMLGTLIEVQAADYAPRPPTPFATATRMAEMQTPVEPGLESVRASVTVRWHFLPR